MVELAMASSAECVKKKDSESISNFQQGDPLVRINLPPLLGRRDAALDMVERLCAVDIFAMSEEDLRRHCEEIIQWAHQCDRNSNTIVFMFSSPDTRERECRLLKHVNVINQLALSIEMLLSIPNAVNADDIALLNRNRVWELAIPIYNELRMCVENGKHRLARYREYVANSLSAENGDRYRLAYMAAMKLKQPNKE